MKVAGVALALVSTTLPLSAQVASRVATTMPPTELAALEAVRRGVWADWFSGDTAALRRSLAPELVAISPGSPHWQGLQESIAGSAKFKADGGRFVSVAFDSSMVHRFGDVVVMFSHYRVITASSQGQRTQKGRATEVFVRSNDAWVHTSWHLDVEPALPPP
jgi:ketosteroid isomerase-like protein